MWPPGLPLPLTPLVGRDRDVSEVTGHLAASRLMTLVGAGGVGKTRLAIEGAAAVAPRFADGANLVNLSGVPDPDLVWAAVARAVGVEQRAGADLAQRVIRVLRQQGRLLVLDNCEHVLAASGRLATGLLGCCPDLWILATSREGLGVPGEVTWRVPSLSFPGPQETPSLTELDSFGAMALFADRARAARPGLEIEAADIEPLRSICARLDGIPLALELAAARASALSIREIADRLDDRFTLLSRACGGPARHQTLHASVDWSHQLLSEPERILFRRLAVFAGGWSLDAAEAVGAGPPVGPREVPRLLAGLVDKSLAQAKATSTGTRYRLQQAIRAYAREQLASSGEMEDAQARHGAYFARLGEQAARRLNGPDQGVWATRLDQEQANLRAAWLWSAADPARAVTGLTMVSGLWEYWLIRGLLDQGAGWLEDALRRAAGPAAARADALAGLALISCLRGDVRRGGDLFAASIALHERAGNWAGHSRALALLGFWRANQGDEAGSAEALDRARLSAGLSRDPYFAAFSLLMAGMAALLAGRIPLARALAAESGRLFADIGNRRGVGYARCVTADCLIHEGAPAECLVILRECIQDFEALLDRWGLLVGTCSVALAHAAAGDWGQAAFALGVADSMGERIGGRPFPGVQAAIDAVAAKTAAALGTSAITVRRAGRAAGRGDRIAAALGLVAPPHPPPAPHDLPLTRRESEITQLIATGLTNRQIAERLVIAQRTVDTHVGHILAKLGCSNRSQAAALIGARRPPAIPG